MCSIALLHQTRQGRGHAPRCMKHQPKRLLRSLNCPVPELPVVCPQSPVKVLTAAVLLAPSFSANLLPNLQPHCCMLAATANGHMPGLASRTQQCSLQTGLVALHTC